MAIKIDNNENLNDTFKIKCPSCGRALSYERRDIKSHRRWPNGYIYCPGCKAPIGHSEANLFKTGDDIKAERKAQEEANKQALIQKRKEYLSNNELLKKDIKKFEQIKKKYLIFGMVILTIGIVMLIVSLVLGFINSFRENDALEVLTGFGITIINPGIFLLIMAIVYNKKILNLKTQIEKNEQNEKDSR